MLKEFDNYSDNDETKNLKRKVASFTDGWLLRVVRVNPLIVITYVSQTISNSLEIEKI